MTVHARNLTKTCQDCPAAIPANGGRKRCSDCQDEERKRLAHEKARRRNKKPDEQVQA